MLEIGLRLTSTSIYKRSCFCFYFLFFFWFDIILCLYVHKPLNKFSCDSECSPRPSRLLGFAWFWFQRPHNSISRNPTWNSPLWPPVGHSLLRKPSGRLITSMSILDTPWTKVNVVSARFHTHSHFMITIATFWQTSLWFTVAPLSKNGSNTRNGWWVITATHWLSFGPWS